MKQKVHNIIGTFFGAIGILVFIMNYISATNEVDMQLGGGFSWWNYMILAFGLVMITLSLIPRESIRFVTPMKTTILRLDTINKVFQLAVLILLSTISALDSHENQHLFSLIMLTGLMGIKYRLFANRGLTIFIIYMAAIIEYSAFSENRIMRGVFVLIFGAFFFGIALIMFYDELSRYLALTKKYHTRLIEVESKLDKLQGETLDPDQMGFTPREKEVLQSLCKTRGSNQEIADMLGIKEQTVKTHIKNIFDKAGVDDRHQLVDLFKNAFLTDSQ